MRKRTLRRVVLFTALSGLGIGAFSGYAYSQIGIASHDVALRGNVVKKLMVMQQNDFTNVTTAALTSFSSDTIPVPASGNYRVLVRFSGESACSAASWCSAVVFVDGIEANPKSGTDFAFDSPGGSTWISPSIDRTSDVIAGTGSVRNVVVDLRLAVVGGGNWGLDDWSVVAELFKV